MNSNEIKITKLEAAKRQIDTSVRMFFSGEDPLATHTVTCAGLQIINDLSDIDNKKNFRHYDDGEYC